MLDSVLARSILSLSIWKLILLISFSLILISKYFFYVIPFFPNYYYLYYYYFYILHNLEFASKSNSPIDCRTAKGLLKKLQQEHFFENSSSSWRRRNARACKSDCSAFVKATSSERSNEAQMSSIYHTLSRHSS